MIRKFEIQAIPEWQMIQNTTLHLKKNILNYLGEVSISREMV